MSEKEPKEGKGEKLVGNPEALINIMITDPERRKKALEEITLEGPKHKQVLNALLLKRLYQLVATIAKNTNKPFVLQSGYEIVIEDGKKEKVIPVMMPIHLDTGYEVGKVVAAVSKAPEHEVLSYIMCLQVLEWALQISDEKAN
jgi:hypothetical protein